MNFIDNQTAVLVNNQPTTLGAFFDRENLADEHRDTVIRSLVECGSFSGDCQGQLLYGKCVIVNRRANQEK